MSLKAKIEAVLYAAEEPVTLPQLAAIFAPEISSLAAASSSTSLNDADHPSAESLIEQGFIEASNLLPLSDEDEMALLAGLQERKHAGANAATAEAQAKRDGRLRERELRNQLKALVEALIEDYAASDRGMEIREVAGGYRIATKPEYHDAVRAFVKSLKPPMKLSLQALETLAVIAYKQPVTAPEVSEVRGVDSAGVLGGLVSRKLITTAGRKAVIGRPILYKTTREFLLRFGLKDLSELPSIEEFEKLAGDLEIGGEETLTAAETSLPFDSGEEREDTSTEAESQPPVATSAVTTAADSAAIAANAGEAGLAVESAQPSWPPSERPQPPETFSLHAGPASSSALNAEAIGRIEATPSAHPTVPIEEMGETQENGENGENDAQS